MEKLIELLNEREKELSPNIQVEWTEFSVGINKWYLISKECGFIKRLVENDKIDRDKMNKKAEYKIYYSGTPREVKQTSIDGLLMLLSISNSPIEDLILYLK